MEMMGSRTKPKCLGRIPGPVGIQTGFQGGTTSAGSMKTRSRRRIPSGSGGKKAMSAGARPVVNSAGKKTASCVNGDAGYGSPDSDTGQHINFINVPSSDERQAWADSGVESSAATTPRQTRTISPADIMLASQETDISRVFEIDLHSSHIGKIENLDKFNKVRILDLSCNHISTVSNLQCNTEVRELKLYDNRIAEINNLDNLKELSTLQLQHNRIRKIGKGLAKQRKLKVLRLDCNQIFKVDAGELSACLHLTTLDVSSNKLDTISAVGCLPNLEELYAANNRLRTVADLSRCKKLQEVDFSGNKLTDLSGLKGLSHLTIVNCSHNCLSSVKSLGKLKCLEELFISGNRVNNLTSLVQLFPALQILDATDNSVDDWEQVCSLGHLADLAELMVSGNPFCRENGAKSSYHAELSRLMPNLDILDGACMKRHSARGRTPLMRPMSANSVVSSKQVENQIKSLEQDITNFQFDFSKTFDSLKSTMESLPDESPSCAISPLNADRITPGGSSRPSSKCGKRSRIQDAMTFAATNF